MSKRPMGKKPSHYSNERLFWLLGIGGGLIVFLAITTVSLPYPKVAFERIAFPFSAGMLMVTIWLIWFFGPLLSKQKQNNPIVTPNLVIDQVIAEYLSEI